MPKSNAGPAVGPWNPGLESEIPRELLPLSTMFRGDNISNDLAEVAELSDFTGLPRVELVAFRPERLVVHELLIRVTADLTVPDGPNYEDLGINLRGMVATVLEKYARPEMAGLVARFDELRAQAETAARDLIAEAAAPEPAAADKGGSFLGRLFSRGKRPAPVSPPGDLAEALRALSKRGHGGEPLCSACLAALVHVAEAIVGARGRLPADNDLLVRLAVRRVCNTFGSDMLGKAVEPIFAKACAGEGYRVLPPQPQPVIMNTKGASASGKSTMRSLQRELAGRLGVPWEDFALISPDYWRKFLLDYDSLGEDYKYAAMLTGHELEIIDKKLDRYMAEKAQQGRMSHLLIDRFRFDSFSPEDEREDDVNLLTRFGSTIFLFFVITPPHETVERAWNRGIKTGRYKAVDDLLFHNVEAFTGMPQLFFSWALSRRKKVHYEFLDNSVPEGERPRTIASGWNGHMNVYDLGAMLDIERYRRIDIHATTPEEVYREPADADERNTGFLEACVERMERIEFVDPRSGRVYAVVENGGWAKRDDAGRRGRTGKILDSLRLPARPASTASADGLDTPSLSDEPNYVVGRI
ncbi:MAG: hypothetical protein AB7L41_06575 [Flavobacteriaceae bacterium]